MVGGCRQHVRDLKHALNSRNSDHLSCRQTFYATDAEPLYDKELFEKYLEALEQSVKKEETEFTHERHANHKMNSLIAMYTVYKDKVKEIQELKSLKSGNIFFVCVSNMNTLIKSVQSAWKKNLITA